MIPLITAALLLQASPAPAAQDTAGRPCRVAVDSMGHYRETTTAAGEKITNGGGGVLAHCVGTGTTISADSFAHYSTVGRLDLIGRVQIRDTGMALDARLASYYLRDERLEAHNNVVAVNRRNGSVLRGPNLRYLRAAKGIRDTVEMYATQRPTVEYRQGAPRDTGRGRPEPYIIVADRMRFRGDDRMWAGGKATIDRSDFAARSDSMMLDQTKGLGVLVRGKPSVEGKGRRGGAAGEAAKSYTLVGTRIELALEQRDVSAVKAMGNGKATGSDWTLTGDTIDLHIANRMLQQTFAWGDSLRPHAISTLYTIQSDSMAIDSPDEVLTESRAFGKAFSTARRDSTATAAETDWISGDTLTARFVQGQDPTSGRPRTRLRQIISRGSARALTHHPENRDTTTAAAADSGGGSAQTAINYSRGQQIDITLLADRIDRVIVAGKADGVHLAPRPAVVADSLRPAGPDTTRSAPPAPPVRPPSATP
ncbi:MAG TPA: hypothetical protein VJ755_06400 [Gemmatimonadales bacterium]|nr:hypothetical protein [Gemmatimonadales bacterium]